MCETGHNNCGESQRLQMQTFCLSLPFPLPNSPSIDLSLPSPGGTFPDTEIQSCLNDSPSSFSYRNFPLAPTNSCSSTSPSTFLGGAPLHISLGVWAAVAMAPVGSKKHWRERWSREICRTLSLSPSQHCQQWQQLKSCKARKEMRTVVAAFSTLLLQAAAKVGFLESPPWLVCGGNIQQCLHSPVFELCTVPFFLGSSLSFLSLNLLVRVCLGFFYYSRVSFCSKVVIMDVLMPQTSSSYKAKQTKRMWTKPSKSVWGVFEFITGENHDENKLKLPKFLFN